MTILNNFKKLVFLYFGAPQGSFIVNNPSSSTNPSDFLTFETANSLLVISATASAASGKATISNFITRIFSFNTAGNGNYMSSSEMAPARFSFITEDFNIVDNNYPADLAGESPTINDADIVTMGSNFHNFKQVYNMTLNNVTTDAKTIYGIQIQAMTNVWMYIKNEQTWLSGDSNQLFPIWVVKFDQPKVLQPGESLTVSYSIDFSNLIDEVNDVTVVQQ